MWAVILGQALMRDRISVRRCEERSDLCSERTMRSMVIGAVEMHIHTTEFAG